MPSDMPAKAADPDPVEAVGALAQALEEAGFTPVLVGGMAMIFLGSRRVTGDIDFLVSAPGATVGDLVALMYRHDLTLISKLNPMGDVVRTIDNARVAAAKAQTESPQSLFFTNEKSRLRVDILLDYPMTAREIGKRAMRIKLESHRVPVASPEDLLKLKEIAYKDRKLATDAQDLDFLRNLLKKRR